MNEKYVLLVEDNADDIALTRKAFQRCHVSNKLQVASDGQEALDFLFGEGKYAGRDTSQLPAVMILDLNLPYVSGLDVLKQIRLNLRTSRLPVVVLSSSVNRQEIDDCYNLGINRYFRKPGNFSQFKQIIDEICSSWLNEDRLHVWAR